MGDSRAMEYMRGRRTLEVNPDHPVIASLKARYDEHGDGDEDAEAMTELLYETSLLTSGFSVESPKEFANRYKLHKRFAVMASWCSISCHAQFLDASAVMQQLLWSYARDAVACMP